MSINGCSPLLEPPKRMKHIFRHSNVLVVLVGVLMMMSNSMTASAFVTTPRHQQRKQRQKSSSSSSSVISSREKEHHSSSSTLSSSSNINENGVEDELKAGSSASEFAYQEMVGLLGAMERDSIPSRLLTPRQRLEIRDHVRTVARTRASLVPLDRIGNVLPGTKWKLQFSSSSSSSGGAGGGVLDDLPKDASVVLEFHGDDGDEQQRRMDYCLEFSQKTLGLNRLAARSTYTVDASKINPGLVTFVYQNIVTDVFGLKGLGVGFFGLLKGRANYIETVFMDHRYWIERGYSPTSGEEYLNVYVKQLGTKNVNGGQSASSSPPPSLPSIGGGLEDQWD